MTKTIEVYQVDAFTEIPGQGNPAGVVAAAEALTTDEMQRIAHAVGFNETVFILPSQLADFRLRYFTPGHETPLCGHATLGAVRFLMAQGVEKALMIETGVGVLPITITAEQEIIMAQDHPKSQAFEGDLPELCRVLGITESDLEPSLPVEYGNTGSWTLLVPVKDQQVLAKMRPLTEEFPAVLKEIPRSSIHPFTILSQEQRTFSARHFSSPFSGTIEDSVTGTASGVMGAYFQRYLYPQEELLTVTIQQGQFVKRSGEVRVWSQRREGLQWVQIAGKAVISPETISINY